MIFILISNEHWTQFEIRTELNLMCCVPLLFMVSYLMVRWYNRIILANVSFLHFLIASRSAKKLKNYVRFSFQSFDVNKKLFIISLVHSFSVYAVCEAESCYEMLAQIKEKWEVDESTRINTYNKFIKLKFIFYYRFVSMNVFITGFSSSSFYVSEYRLVPVVVYFIIVFVVLRLLLFEIRNKGISSWLFLAVLALSFYGLVGEHSLQSRWYILYLFQIFFMFMSYLWIGFVKVFHWLTYTSTPAVNEILGKPLRNTAGIQIDSTLYLYEFL